MTQDCGNNSFFFLQIKIAAGTSQVSRKFKVDESAYELGLCSDYRPICVNRMKFRIETRFQIRTRTYGDRNHICSLSRSFFLSLELWKVQNC